MCVCKRDGLTQRLRLLVYVIGVPEVVCACACKRVCVGVCACAPLGLCESLRLCMWASGIACL